MHKIKILNYEIARIFMKTIINVLHKTCNENESHKYKWKIFKILTDPGLFASEVYPREGIICIQLI